MSSEPSGPDPWSLRPTTLQQRQGNSPNPSSKAAGKAKAQGKGKGKGKPNPNPKGKGKGKGKARSRLSPLMLIPNTVTDWMHSTQSMDSTASTSSMTSMDSLASSEATPRARKSFQREMGSEMDEEDQDGYENDEIKDQDDEEDKEKDDDDDNTEHTPIPLVRFPLPNFRNPFALPAAATAGGLASSLTENDAPDMARTMASGTDFHPWEHRLRAPDNLADNPDEHSADHSADERKHFLDSATRLEAGMRVWDTDDRTRMVVVAGVVLLLAVFLGFALRWAMGGGSSGLSTGATTTMMTKEPEAVSVKTVVMSSWDGAAKGWRGQTRVVRRE